MSKEWKRRKRRRQPEQDSLQPVYISTYEVTTEPIHNRQYEQLPRRVKNAIDRLYYQSQREPRKAIPELRKLVKQYPDVPTLYNFLSVAYSQAGQPKKAEAVTRKNYERNPDYLFARLNYAELCLMRGDYDKIEEIFENKFDLKSLYPERDRFHVSEVAGFMGLAGVYFLETGERDAAEKYDEILQEIAPDNPMARKLHQRLHPNLLQRLLMKLTGR